MAIFIDVLLDMSSAREFKMNEDKSEDFHLDSWLRHSAAV